MVEDEWQCSDVIDAGRSRDSNNMVDVVHSNFIHTTIFIPYRAYFFNGRKICLPTPRCLLLVVARVLLCRCYVFMVARELLVGLRC